MIDEEECVCLNGKNCCKCGEPLEKEDLIPRTNPYAVELCDDHSDHLICDNCLCIAAKDI